MQKLKNGVILSDFCARGGIWTPDHSCIRRTLYQLSYTRIIKIQYIIFNQKTNLKLCKIVLNIFQTH
jgi:hypothetical protein